MPSFDEYLGPTGRPFELIFGIALLAPAAFFAYFGATGAWAYLHGSRAAPADPLACGIGLGASVWLGFLAVRLISGRNRERPLLPGLFLLLTALGSLAGAIWMFWLFRDEPLTEQLRGLEVFGFAGVAGLVLWWRRQPWTCLRMPPNLRLKLSARWRRCWRNAQWKPSFLSAAPAGRSLSAIR